MRSDYEAIAKDLEPKITAIFTDFLTPYSTGYKWSGTLHPVWL